MLGLFSAWTTAEIDHAARASAAGEFDPAKVRGDACLRRDGGELHERIMFEDILYVEAMQNYVILYLAVGKLIVYATLSGIESQLPADRWQRR